MVVGTYGKTGMNAIIDGGDHSKTNPKAGSIRYVHVAIGRSPWKAPGDGYEWSHVVSVYDGAARTMRTCVNGGSYPWTKDIPGVGITASDAPLTIQGEYTTLDEIAIWDRPLTDDEIRALYNNGNGVEIK